MDKEEVKIYNGIIIFSILFFLILIIFIVTYIRQSRKFIKEKIQAEVHGSEMERKKLSSDLHDDLGPILASIKIYTNALSKHSSNDEILIQKINKNLDLCLQQVRSMANDLMPNTLKRTGLKKAVEEFIQNIESVAQFQIHLIFPNFDLNFSSASELNIYRIIQEIVTNTINHANCTMLEIVFEKIDSILQVSTKDNGTGFDMIKVKEKNLGCGISNIYNRVNLLNGKINMNANLNNGVSYIISIPLHKNINYEQNN